MMYYYDSFAPYHFFGLGPLFMVLFWGFVLYFGFLLIKKLSVSEGKSRALEILKERYAKGEISKEQFESTKKDLQ